MNAVLKARSFDRFPEIFKRRFEDFVVIIVNRDDLVRVDDADSFDALLGIHRQQYPHDSRPAEMKKREVYLRVATRYFMQVVMNERVARNVKTERSSVRCRLKLK